VSDTRTVETDGSGAFLADGLTAAGHTLVHRAIVRDDLEALRAHFAALVARTDLDVVVATGGTGLTARDVTPDALAPLVTKQIPGFGELFRHLSFAEIGAATIQSRAMAALCAGVLVFLLPGSTSGCRLALDAILLPQLDSRTRPCNFATLLPRIRGAAP
jgi:molybdenum cofactor biosynthesis protein B